MEKELKQSLTSVENYERQRKREEKKEMKTQMSFNIENLTFELEVYESEK